MNRPRRLSAIALAISAFAANADEALDDRLATLASGGDRILHYREVRDGGLFAGSVEYSGRLEYLPESGDLIKWVDSPAKAKLLVTGEQVEVTAGKGRTRRFPLDARPDLAGLMAGLRALLAGDPSALDRVFLADYLEAEDGSWVLHLKPRAPSLEAHLVLLEVRGRDDEIAFIDRVDAEGRRHRIEIVPADGG